MSVIDRVMGRMRNKPCAFGHDRPTRLCSSCGPFPDPADVEGAIEDVRLAFARLDSKYGRDWTEWQDVRDAMAKLKGDADETKD